MTENLSSSGGLVPAVARPEPRRKRGAFGRSALCSDNGLVRLGIRAQILLSVAALLLLGLLPLLFAVTSLARASLLHSWEQSARGLGRAVAGHVAEAQRGRPGSDLQGLLDAQLGEPVGAIAIYDAAGRLVQRAGGAADVEVLPATVTPSKDQVLEVSTARGAALVVLAPSAEGAVGVLLHTDPKAVGVGPLVRLVALYTGLLGLGLLLLTYFVLTRIVVVPVVELSSAAQRVADGARQLNVPRSGGRELIALGSSLARMTERLRAEERHLRQKVTELETATAELKRAQDGLVRSERLASVGRLAAGLAHEIGNPIAAMLGLLDLLIEGGLEPEEQRDFLGRIKRETERVNRVLRELLDFARPAVRDTVEGEAGAAASVAEAVEHVVALLRPQKAFAEVEIATTLAAGLPAVAMLPARIEQVLLNLMLNAADAIPGKGGRVAIEAEADDAVVRIAIEDNGGGIAPSVRERLFEPFVTTKEPGKGTGLGLAVCRGLVEAAGGRIELAEGSAGARFVLELPRAGR